MLAFDPDPNRWFLSDRNNLHTELSLFTSGNYVDALVDGANYMGIFNKLLGILASGDKVYYAGWRLGLSQQLVFGHPETTVESVMTKACSRDVDLKVMLSGHVAHKNAAAYRYLKKAGLRCVLYNKFPRFGSAHQKLAVVESAGNLDAFCGGIDIAPRRLDFPGHRLGGWHDVQCHVRGPACHDLKTTFVERWNEAVGADSAIIEKGRESRYGLDQPTSGTHHVQALRTYAGISGHTFAPHGELSSYRACLKAISLARSYIYIEDQYFVSPELADALTTALTSNPGLHLIVLVPKRPNFYLRLFYMHQQAIIDRLRNAAPDRFAIFHLDNVSQDHSGEQTYVHSKLMIIDDTWAQIGSMNFNRRSTTYDEEASIAIVDSDTEGHACRFARDLRIRLWAEHLDLDPADSSMKDAIKGFRRWLERSEYPHVPASVHVTPRPINSRLLDPLWNAAHRIGWRAVDPLGGRRHDLEYPG